MVLVVVVMVGNNRNVMMVAFMVGNSRNVVVVVMVGTIEVRWWW